MNNSDPFSNTKKSNELPTLNVGDVVMYPQEREIGIVGKNHHVVDKFIMQIFIIVLGRCDHEFLRGIFASLC